MTRKTTGSLLILASFLCLMSTAEAGSIWARKDTNAKDMYSDDVARKIGDVLTITIKEVSDMTQVDQDLIRLWEETYSHLRPSKSKSGRRLFKPEDVKKIFRIKDLKEKGYSDEDINRLLQGHKIMAENTVPEQVETDKSHSMVLLFEMQNGLKQILNILNDPIDQVG